jgi:hypothetical protein
MLGFWVLTVSTILQLAWIEAELFEALPSAERKRREASGQRLSYPEMAAIAVPSATVDCSRLLRCCRGRCCGSPEAGVGASSDAGSYTSVLHAKEEGEMRSLRHAGGGSSLDAPPPHQGDKEQGSPARGYSTGSLPEGLSMAELSIPDQKQKPQEARATGTPDEETPRRITAIEPAAGGENDGEVEEGADTADAAAAGAGSSRLLHEAEGESSHHRPRPAMVRAARAALGARSAGLVNWVSVISAAGIIATAVGVGAAYVDFVANVVSSAIPQLDAMEAAAIVSRLAGNGTNAMLLLLMMTIAAMLLLCRGRVAAPVSWPRCCSCVVAALLLLCRGRVGTVLLLKPQPCCD